MTNPTDKLILVVEDTIDLAGFVMDALGEMGFQTHHSSSPDGAIEFLQTATPDLIILDIGLPGMTGWQLLEIINERRREKGIFIVVTTAFQDPANRLVGKLQEVDAYLLKPFRFQELQQTVNALLQTHQ